LLSVDEPNFRYFVSVASSQEGEVPGNPESKVILLEKMLQDTLALMQKVRLRF